MTQDELIAMAREAVSQITIQANGDVFYSFYGKELEAFAKLVAAHERELCAKVCEDIYTGEEACGDWPTPRCALPQSEQEATMNKSTLKTKMRRAGFKNSPNQWTQWNPDGKVLIGLHRQAWRNNWMYCKGFGRHFRVRWHDGVVDIGEVYATFDRWANSTERTLSIEDFAKEYLQRGQQ